MTERASIDFVLQGKVEGVEITPRTIGLSQFNEFNQQVETFIGGSQKLKLDQVRVEVAQGSYVLRALLPAVVLSSLDPDLKLMGRQDVLGELDIKRAEVVQKWQIRAKSNPDILRRWVVVPFNWDDAQRAAKLDWKRLRPAGVERDALKDDIKIIAQAAGVDAEFVITDDAESFFRYWKTFKDAGEVQFEAIKLEDGFDRAYFDPSGQRDFTDGLDEGNGAQS